MPAEWSLGPEQLAGPGPRGRHRGDGGENVGGGEHPGRHHRHRPNRHVLRVTHVFRRENGEWKIVHRHGNFVPRTRAPRRRPGAVRLRPAPAR